MTRKPAVVPPATVRWFTKGEHCIDAEAGSVVVVRHKGFVPALLRFGQRLRYWWARLWGDKTALAVYCELNHVMTVLTGGANATVEEQTFRGGRVSSLVDYQAEAYAVITFAATKAQKSATVAAAQWSVGLAYGIVSIVGLGLSAFLGGFPLNVGWSTTLICSADSCLNARCQGLIPDRSDLSVMPADWARWFDLRLP